MFAFCQVLVSWAYTIEVCYLYVLLVSIILRFFLAFTSSFRRILYLGKLKNLVIHTGHVNRSVHTRFRCNHSIVRRWENENYLWNSICTWVVSHLKVRFQSSLRKPILPSSFLKVSCKGILWWLQSLRDNSCLIACFAHAVTGSATSETSSAYSSLVSVHYPVPKARGWHSVSLILVLASNERWLPKQRYPS